jgi:acyl carrier protein
MDRDAIRTIVQDTLRNIVDDDGVTITDETVAGEVGGWDSTNHVRLIVALEEEFDIRFETRESVAPATVGGLLDLIASKMKA